jgi:DNA-binding CsgD family transcriptional regulator
MGAFSTTTAFSHVVGAIYDCAIDPRRWPETLTALRHALGYANAILGLNELPSGRLLLNVSSGIESPWLERVPDYAADIIDLWGGPEVAYTYPLDRPAVTSRVNPAALREPLNRYVREWAYPQGLVDSIAIPLARDATSIGSVAFARHRDAGPIGESEIAAAQLLLPHLQRAVAISRLLDARTAAAADFEAVINGLRTPVLIVDAGRTLLHANRAARVLIEAGTTLVVHGKVLSSSTPGAARALAAAVVRACTSDLALGEGSLAVPLGGDGGVHAAYVLPLRRRAIDERLVAKPAAAIFVASPRTWPGAAAHLVTALFGLTPTETRVFDGIAAGQTPAEVARSLAVAPSTVHTHLLRVFEKTGVHRQAELVQLAAALTSPI